MKLSITLRDNHLVVTASEDIGNSWCNGGASMHVPDWASRQALLALIDAAIIEAESKLKEAVKL
jgi:hypothetical protein